MDASQTIRTVSVGTFVTSCFATTIGVIVSVSFLTFNLFHRDKRFMKMSSPNLNVLISVGGIILNTACLLYGMDYFFAARYEEATVTCQMRLWMIMFAVSLIFGPIFTKSWRVYQIFHYAGIKKVVIKDTRLFLICGLVMCMDAALLFIWQIVDLLRSQKVTILDEGANTTAVDSSLVLVQTCTSNNINVWLTIIVVWKSIFFSYGLFVAWKTRNVLLPPMKDSPSIVISVIFTMCWTSLAVVISTSLHRDPDAVYVLHILSITVCCIVVQVAVFFPKVMYWWKTPIENPVRLSTSMYDYGVSHTEEEMCQLIAENKVLKKTLNEKSTRLSKLEANLQTAKDRLKSISIKDFKSDTGIDVDLTEVKLDSGLDVDLSEISSTHDHQSTNEFHARRAVESYLNFTCTTEEHNTDSAENSPENIQRSNSFSGRATSFRKQKSRTSMCSIQSYFRSAEYYEQLRETIKSKNDIIGSVAKSYNLDDTDDTHSYVSSYIPLRSTRRKLNYPIRDNDLYVTSDLSTALSNDQLYPPSDEYSFSSTTAAKEERSAKTGLKKKRQKRYKTPKPTYEKTKQGDKIVVRKCYYL